MRKIKALVLIAAMAVMITSCSKSANDFGVEEKSIGPYLAVCCDRFSIDENTCNQEIDELVSKLFDENVEPLGTFIINYNRYDYPEPYIIYGCLVDNKMNQSLSLKLERHGFTVRYIGVTNCMTIQANKQEVSECLPLKVVQQKIDQYSLNHGFVSIPNGETGLTMLRIKDSVLFAAEIKPL